MERTYTLEEIIELLYQYDLETGRYPESEREGFEVLCFLLAKDGKIESEFHLDQVKEVTDLSQRPIWIDLIAEHEEDDD